MWISSDHPIKLPQIDSDFRSFLTVNLINHVVVVLVLQITIIALVFDYLTQCKCSLLFDVLLLPVFLVVEIQDINLTGPVGDLVNGCLVINTYSVHRLEVWCHSCRLPQNTRRSWRLLKEVRGLVLWFWLLMHLF